MSAKHHRPEWHRLARVAKDKAGWRCERCASHGFLEAHHRSTDPQRFYDLANIEVLCRSCHIEIHRRDYRPKSPEIAAWDSLVKDLLGTS